MDEIAVAGRRFGLTADTHDELVDWPSILGRLTAAWGEIDGVLHCGDLSSAAALDGLAAVAPTFATRSDGDPPEAPPTLVDGPRVLSLGGVRVGLTFNLADEAMSPAGAAALFGGPVAACVYGGTHEARLEEIGGVLFVNPGSPSLAKMRTAAVLTIQDGRPSVEIVEIG
ncbi:MAG TPA: metallophosphoesterase family protein [Caulobacteraceae bacterium]|nr:metallophosphoesterase family protein [Caulobacteraceae bacterium]